MTERVHAAYLAGLQTARGQLPRQPVLDSPARADGSITSLTSSWALDEVAFGSDSNGARLPAPVAMLIAAHWDLSGTYDPGPHPVERRSRAGSLKCFVSGISRRNGYLRLSSFAERNGQLYTAVEQHIYERIEGAEPHWRVVYTNFYPGHSDMAARDDRDPDPSGHDESCSAAVEGNAARIVRVNPRDGSEATQAPGFSPPAWGMPGQLRDRRR